MIKVRSLVSHRTGEPVIEVTWGKEAGQLDFSAAFQLAHQLMAAAEAAIHDAYLFEFITKTVGIDKTPAANLIAQMRDFRDAQEKGEQRGPVEGS